MKETYYFSHDYNASQDPKMIILLSECGLAGIGMYWILVELMHQQPNGKMTTEAYKSFIKMYCNFDNRGEHLLNKIEQMLIKTGLFVKKENVIFSNRVLKHKEMRKNISEKRSKAGKISAEKRSNKCSAKDKQVFNNKKERKGKERKILRESEQSSPTPSQIAKKFFEDFDTQEKVINNIADKYKLNKIQIRNEINKFISYWTEPTKNGKKQRWETEKTFEITRRISTWLNRSNNFSNKQKYGKISN